MPRLDPSTSCGDELTAPALPDPAVAGVSGISSSHAYLAGFAKLFPDLATTRLAIRHYTLHEKLGAGAMGVVYAAVDAKLGRKVALKVVRSTDDGRARARLLREAKNLAQLSHPNIVQVFEVGEYQGEIFIAMEYVEGRSLREWIDATNPDLGARLDMLIDAGRGVAAAHAKGIIHRDIKPENILVGGDRRARVADFGVASAQLDMATEPRQSAATLPVTNTLTSGAGTPGYMSPEQHLHGELDRRSDVFGFCVVAWEVVFGQRPFTGATSEALRASICAGQITAPRVRGVPNILEKLLRRGLSVRPDERPPDMESVVAVLVRIRRPRSHGLWLAAGTVGIAIGLTYVMSRPPVMCTDVARGLDEVWSARIGAMLVAAVPVTRRDAMRQIVATLNGFAGDLRTTRDALCEQHVRGLLTPRAYERALECLDDGQRVLESQARALKNAKTRGFMITPFEAATAREKIARCSDRGYLAAGVEPPEPARYKESDAIRKLRTIGEQELTDGELQSAAQTFERAVARARTLGHAPTLAAVLLDAGRAYLRLRHGHAAIAALSESRMFAYDSRDPFLAADAGLLLDEAAVASNDVVRTWRYDILGMEGGRRPEMVVEVELAYADLFTQAGQSDMAELCLTRARDGLASHVTLGGMWRYRLPRIEALLAMSRGQPREALATMERAWRELELLTDLDHPLCSEARGRDQILLGQIDSAETSLIDARSAYIEAFGPESSQVTSLNVALARIYEAQGRRGEMVTTATHADAVLRRRPDEPMAYRDRVAIALMLGKPLDRFDAARARYEAGWRALRAYSTVDTNPPKMNELFFTVMLAAERLAGVTEPRDVKEADEVMAWALERLAQAGTVEPTLEVFVHAVAADVARERGDFQQVRHHVEAVEANLPGVSEPALIAYVNFTISLVKGPRDPTTRILLDESVRIYEELGWLEDVAIVSAFRVSGHSDDLLDRCSDLERPSDVFDSRQYGGGKSFETGE